MLKADANNLNIRTELGLRYYNFYYLLNQIGTQYEYGHSTDSSTR